jgi:hypothetical protein
MSKSVRWVLSTVLVTALVVVTSSVVIAARPDRYRVRRSDDALVSAQAVFALASNPMAWAQWSPWAPGTVTMTLLEARPPAHVTMRLEFTDPIRSVATGTIEIRPAANRHATVTWTVEGTFGWAGKAWSLVTDMDAAIGQELGRGLRNLSRLPELTRRWGQLAQAAR